MKKMFLSAALVLISTSAFAITNQITYKQIVLDKNMQDQNGLALIASFSTQAWCNEIRGPAHFENFKTAQYVEGLADGLYLCDGEFVRYPMSQPVDIFSINNCSPKTLADLNKNCH